MQAHPLRAKCSYQQRKLLCDPRWGKSKNEPAKSRVNTSIINPMVNSGTHQNLCSPCAPQARIASHTGAAGSGLQPGHTMGYAGLPRQLYLFLLSLCVYQCVCQGSMLRDCRSRFYGAARVLQTASSACERRCRVFQTFTHGFRVRLEQTSLRHNYSLLRCMPLQITLIQGTMGSSWPQGVGATLLICI